jgi:dihydrofolate synthase/folylpolyglutamate synthase
VAAEFESSLRYLYGLQSYGIKPGLSRIIGLLGALGDPHRSFQVFHVAGTNGKGSTAAMLAAMLVKHGYRVGLYTSPHLIDFTERVRVDGTAITHAQAASLTESVRHAAETRLSESPTFFEATTALAFTHFADAGVQYGVIEVGLGGRFDATNVVDPIVSVITTIGIDHQEYLGHTLEQIAAEKAGIIKRGVPVVTGRIDDAPLSIILTVARESQSPAFSLGRDFDTLGDSSRSFSYQGLSRSYDALTCPLPGRHQMDNAACALAALETAYARGMPADEAGVREGLRTVCWPGRLELLGQRPSILLDGAHNPQAVDALAAYLKAEHRRLGPQGRLIFLVGMMRDKDRRGVLARLAGVPGVHRMILTKADHPRAAEPEVLATDASDLPLAIEVTATVQEGFVRARSLAHPEDLICVTGSLLVVGEAKAILEKTTVSDLKG